MSKKKTKRAASRPAIVPAAEHYAKSTGTWLSEHKGYVAAAGIGVVATLLLRPAVAGATSIVTPQASPVTVQQIPTAPSSGVTTQLLILGALLLGGGAIAYANWD